MRLGVVVTVCCSALLFVLAVMSSVAGAAPAPNMSGIWLVYVPASNPSPAQIFVMHDVANRITGTWGEFTLSGTFSPSTGTATLCAGCGQTFGVANNELAGEGHVQVDQHGSVKPPDSQGGLSLRLGSDWRDSAEQHRVDACESAAPTRRTPKPSPFADDQTQPEPRRAPCMWPSG